MLVLFGEEMGKVGYDVIILAVALCISTVIEIGRFITGAKRYYLQKFINSGSILSNNPQDFEISDIKLAECLQTVRKFISHAEIRGY